MAPVQLKRCFTQPLLRVMNFLNEVVQRYPEAISFAPGRPEESLFDVPGALAAVATFVAHRARERGVDRERIYQELGQYGPTRGIIGDLVARHLELDEGILAAPEAILVTVGAQEGMAVLLAGLFDDGDCLLATDPTYIGITGFAAVLGIPVEPVPAGPRGITSEAVEAALARVRERGLRPRALYDVPDFNNPLGTSLPLAERHRLLALAARESLLIFEDNPYGMFAYDGHRRPVLKALEQQGEQQRAPGAGDGEPVVIYLGTFSKTLFPSLRVGYLVADQRVEGSDVALAQELSKVKSLVTVNTTPLAQAAAGGLLLAAGGSLAVNVEPKVEVYRRRRDTLLAALEAEFPRVGETSGERIGDDSDGVRWNRPEGGFFLTVDLPFDFGEAELETCAGDFGLIACPMSFFTLSPGRERQVRFAFSYVTEDEIREGVSRFAAFVASRMNGG